MELLATIRESERFKTGSSTPPNDYHLRKAARAVVLDADGSVALLHVNRYGYHKLPGGGVKENENLVTALKREVREEIGCDIEIVGEIGRTDERWNKIKEFQQSFCYLTKVIGQKGQSALTDKEKRHGFETVWTESIEKAIELLRHDKPRNYEGRMIQPRDIVFLQAARTKTIKVA